MLRELGLEEYVTEPAKADSKELMALDEQLASLAENTFRVEEHLIKLLKEQKAVWVYPKISSEFLSLSNEKVVQYASGILEHKKFETIKVPKFGVYNLNSPDMKIQMGKALDITSYKTNCDYFFEVVHPIPLSDTLCGNLAKSSGLFLGEPTILRMYEGGIKTYGSRKSNTEKDTKNKFDKIGKPIALKSTFHCIFPNETRAKVLEAKKIFGDQLFIVAETKPEDWSQEKYIPRIVRDPLLIGVINDKSFYIAEFNTTPLERYVRIEFT